MINANNFQIDKLIQGLEKVSIGGWNLRLHAVVGRMATKKIDQKVTDNYQFNSYRIGFTQFRLAA